jgi:hypothetical protein
MDCHHTDTIGSADTQSADSVSKYIEFDTTQLFHTSDSILEYVYTYADNIGFKWSKTKNNVGSDINGNIVPIHITLKCTNWGEPHPPKPIHEQQYKPRSSTKCNCTAQLNINYQSQSNSYQFGKVDLLHVSRCIAFHKPKDRKCLIEMSDVSEEMIQCVEQCVRSTCTTTQTRTMLMQQYDINHINDRLIQQLMHTARVRINGPINSDGNKLMQDCIEHATAHGTYITSPLAHNMRYMK